MSSDLIVSDKKIVKVAIIAGESSGDLLAADLITALRQDLGERLHLVGVGGEAMSKAGLDSLFDYNELSIVGASAIVARLPQLLMRIRQTTKHIISARPDILIIVDSPGFTHRVARRVHEALPDVPIINYVCPTVWAWKEHRATRMTGYINHVLSIFPFEPEVVRELGGPPITYVGHRLISDASLQDVHQAQMEKQKGSAGVTPGDPFRCLLLPGSRSSEISRLMDPLGKCAEILEARNPGMVFQLAAVPRHEATIRKLAAEWAVPVEIKVGAEGKWQAMRAADVAIAASGTVVLELAMAGIPCVSIYKLDLLARFIVWRIKTWTAALPNHIVDYPVIPEYVNESVRPGRLARWAEKLAQDSLDRKRMTTAFQTLRLQMETDEPPAEHAARIISKYLKSQN